MLLKTILTAVVVFVILTLILVALLLFIKTKLTPSGTVKININDGSKVVEVTPGGNLLSTLAQEKIFLPLHVFYVLQILLVRRCVHTL